MGSFFNILVKRFGFIGILALSVSVSSPAFANPTITTDGGFQHDIGAFDVSSGELENGSEIELPNGFPRELRERVSQSVHTDGRLAPNSYNIVIDRDYVTNAVETALTEGNTPWALSEDGLELDGKARFSLWQRRGAHAFAEGTRVTVINAAGETVSEQTVWVRGQSVNEGPEGYRQGHLPRDARLNVEFSDGDQVVVEMLNLRENGGEPQDSGLFIMENNGQIVVEDFVNNDFNDGKYMRILEGTGIAFVESELDETWFDAFIETDSQQIVETERRNVEIANNGQLRTLPHLGGAVVDGQQTPYVEPSGAAEIETGSSGLRVTGQLRPIGRRPLVISANAAYEPFNADDEAFVTATLNARQYLNRTHELVDPERGLYAPTGIFSNTRTVGYVPDETVITLGSTLSATDGIFDIDPDNGVTIFPGSFDGNRRGESAYERNVGGVLITLADGTREFYALWTQDGNTSQELVFLPGEVTQIEYALVPQQAGQALRPGELYQDNGALTIITASENPENFLEVSSLPQVYAVEDALGSGNVAVANFNGRPGFYVERPGDNPQSTFDLGGVNGDNGEDAFISASVVPGQEVVTTGQPGYQQTTRAGGFYIGGGVTTGLGNAEVATTTTDILLEREVIEQIVDTTELTGTINFSLDNDGEVDFAALAEDGSLVDNISVVGQRQARDIFSIGDWVEVGRESTTDTETSLAIAPLDGEVNAGFVMNLAGTPWTSAAWQAGAEVYARDTLIGQRAFDNGSEGVRLYTDFHLLGEQKRDGYAPDADGNMVPLFETVATGEVDENGVEIHDFVRDANGMLIPLQVGTGRGRGPASYIAAQSEFGGYTTIEGGLRFRF